MNKADFSIVVERYKGTSKIRKLVANYKFSPEELENFTTIITTGKKLKKRELKKQEGKKT